MFFIYTTPYEYFVKHIPLPGPVVGHASAFTLMRAVTMDSEHVFTYILKGFNDGV
jgi:hypothetical protein